jgi:hypothetical protein
MKQRLVILVTLEIDGETQVDATATAFAQKRAEAAALNVIQNGDAEGMFTVAAYVGTARVIPSRANVRRVGGPRKKKGQAPEAPPEAKPAEHGAGKKK